MSVVIRLARGGKTHRPVYRVAVADSRRARNGKYLEIIGQYNPAPSGQDKEVDLDLARVDYWLSKGAQASDRVKSIIAKAKNLN